MVFDKYWEALEARLGRAITGRIELSAAQFKKMQAQAYAQGYKQAEAEAPASAARSNVDAILEQSGLSAQTQANIRKRMEARHG